MQAEQALNRAEIPTLGPGYTVRADRKSPEGARVPRHMLAVLEAESAEDAEARVERQVCPTATTTRASPAPRAAQVEFSFAHSAN